MGGLYLKEIMAKSSSKVRCAVIGLGMGWNHAKAFKECPEAELVACVDMNPAIYEKVKDWIPAEAFFTDYKEMLKKVKPDLVTIALPNFLHATVAIDAMRAGASVLGEKPMAMTTREAIKIRDEAAKLKRLFGLNLSYRFTPQARALKGMAEEGFLGKPYHARTQWTRLDGFPRFGGWFGQKKLSGGGPLIDLGVHRIDLALWLMGNPKPLTVSGATHHHIGVTRGKATKQKFDVEDLAAGFVRLENGVSLVFEISWGNLQRKTEDMFTQVVGTEGALIHSNPVDGYDFKAEYVKREAGQYVRGEVFKADADFRNPYAEMVHCIVNKKPFLATAEDGIAIQQILDGLYKSAQTGREVKVKA